MAKPAKGKMFAKKVKNPKTGRTKTVSYGQSGKAKTDPISNTIAERPKGSMGGRRRIVIELIA